MLQNQPGAFSVDHRLSTDTPEVGAILCYALTQGQVTVLCLEERIQDRLLAKEGLDE